jgi:outer membrane receptor protein involved in Fe transport
MLFAEVFMREAALLSWFLLLLSLTPASGAAAQTTSSSQTSIAEIEMLRSRLRALDEERAQLAQRLADLEKRASAASVTAPAAARTPASDVLISADEVRYLETVVVSGTRREAVLATVPAAVTVVGEESIQDKQRGINLEESLRRVPGALLRDQLGGSTRVTISIRGAGATTDNGRASGALTDKEFATAKARLLRG